MSQEGTKGQRSAVSLRYMSHRLYGLLRVPLWNYNLRRWSSQEEGSRRFVIIKRFMGNYNVPFLYGGAQPVSRYEAILDEI